MRQLFIILLVIILTINTVQALGVIPSSQEVNYQPGKNTVHKIKIVNNEGAKKQVAVYVEGDLSNLMSVDETVIDFKEGEKEKLILITLNHPASTTVQGKIEGKIVARELTGSSGQISALLSISSKLTLNIPYEGIYATTKLYVGDFSSGKGNFIVEVQNQGTEDIAAAKVLLTVTKTSGETVTTLISPEARISKKTTHHFTLPWEANVPSGSYLITATTTYDGQSKQDQKLFIIGSPKITISHIDVQDFTLGGIAKFNLYLQNEWSNTIEDVYATVKVKKGTETYATSTTQTIFLPALSTNSVQAYWDTKNVIAGNYALYITIFYSDKIQEEVIPIIVKQNSITTNLATGQVSGKSSGGEGGNPTTILLALLFIVVLGTNIILFRKLLKKK